MEKINNKRAIRNGNKDKGDRAEKGTVTVRKRGNSFEARIRLEINNKIGGIDTNPRLSRSGLTEEIARQGLAQLIIDTYLIKQNNELIDEGVFSEECEENLKYFKEYSNAKEDIVLHKGISSNISFAEFAVLWINYRLAKYNL